MRAVKHLRKDARTTREISEVCCLMFNFVKLTASVNIIIKFLIRKLFYGFALFEGCP